MVYRPIDGTKIILWIYQPGVILIGFTTKENRS